MCSVAFGVVWCLLCFCNGIVTAAGLCTGPLPVRFCGPTHGGHLYALIRQFTGQFTGSMQHATGRVERPGKS